MRIAVITALGLIATPAPLSAQTSGTVEPTAGTWRSFVISSRFELRAPPPPDAAASAKEIGRLKEIAKQRDPAARDLIAYWDTGAVLSVERDRCERGSPQQFAGKFRFACPCHAACRDARRHYRNLGQQVCL